MARQIPGTDGCTELTCMYHGKANLVQLEAVQSRSPRYRELVIVATAPWALFAEVPPDVDCYTLGNGECIAPRCRLHGGVDEAREGIL